MGNKMKSALKLQQIDRYPEKLLSCDARALQQIFPQPTLLHLTGKQQRPIFISVLLHGNETTGFLAVQQLLKKYAGQVLPRSISIFFGNTQAAELNVRRLEQQPDYNRIWPATEMSAGLETQIAEDIVAVMRQKQVFMSIDIHNNTGLNPHYACINKLDKPFLQLANLFGRIVVYFTRPLGVQSGAFAELCPSVTLECGRPEQQKGVDHALSYLNDCLHLKELNQSVVHHQDIELVHTVAQVKVKPSIDFSFHDNNSDLLFKTDLERFNFTEIPAGTCFGLIKEGAHMPLSVIDEQGVDITEQFFTFNGKRLEIKRATIPSMLTLNEQVIRQDCLCYLMENIPLEK